MAAKEEKKKDPKAPKSKRPTSAWQFFQKERMKRNFKKGMKATKTFKECAKLWRNLSPSRKSKYKRMAANDRERVETENVLYFIACHPS